MAKKPGEFELIAQYFAPLSGQGSFNLFDDAALLTPKPNHSLVITQDAIAQDIHFFADDPPYLIAKKALRVNLSDLAAKGATPISFSLALGLANDWSEEWVSEFAKGLAQDCEQFNIDLSGGDTFKTNTGFIISITAIGEIPDGHYTSRLGASEGDAIFVTGTIGDGALGLLARQGKLKQVADDYLNYLTDRYLLPLPRTDFAPLIQEYASASMDISDGLVADLEKLCAASSVGAEIAIDNIPLSPAAKAVIELESDYLGRALTGGDDYEILFAVPQTKLSAFEEALIKFSIPVSQIGEITCEQEVILFDSNGKKINFEKKGYDHSGENS